MKIKLGDTVMVRTGSFKGKTGKVIATDAKKGQVVVEGVNVRKVHQKPSTKYPQGGVQSETKPIAVHKVGVVNPTKKSATSRIGYKLNKSGKKIRILRQAKGKEL